MQENVPVFVIEDEEENPSFEPEQTEKKHLLIHPVQKDRCDSCPCCCVS